MGRSQIYEIHSSTAPSLDSRRNLCAGAGARGDLRMPSCNVDVFPRQRKLCGFHEVDGDESRYVGDGVTCSADEWADSKLAFEDRQERGYSSLVGFSPGCDLGDLHILHGRVQVAKNLRDRKEQVMFELAIPHLDHRLFEGAD